MWRGMGQGSPFWHVAGSPGRPEEPGKETEKVGLPPSPFPQALGTRRAASCTDNWGWLNPFGAGIRESREQLRCAHMFLWVWPKCCVPHRWGLPLAALLNTPALES